MTEFEEHMNEREALMTLEVDAVAEIQEVTDDAELSHEVKSGFLTRIKAWLVEQARLLRGPSAKEVEELELSPVQTLNPPKQANVCNCGAQNSFEGVCRHCGGRV